MAIAAKEATIPKQYSTTGAIPQMAIKFDGCNNVASGGTYTLNPFGEDMVIMEAYIYVVTADSSNGTIDIGLDDDALGTSIGVEVFDEFVLDAGMWEGLATQAVDTTTTRPIWLKSGTATDSYLSIVPGSAAGTGDADFNVILIVARKADFA